ncbi:unnamed protein product [Fusarium graminearum]|nr:unnamed protein product [Fusarium graminearum]
MKKQEFDHTNHEGRFGAYPAQHASSIGGGEGVFVLSCHVVEPRQPTVGSFATRCWTWSTPTTTGDSSASFFFILSSSAFVWGWFGVNHSLDSKLNGLLASPDHVVLGTEQNRVAPVECLENAGRCTPKFKVASAEAPSIDWLEAACTLSGIVPSSLGLLK